jgi:hypothetical protein
LVPAKDGFCYNIGRIVSAMGVVFFGLFLLALLLPELNANPQPSEIAD